MLDQTIRNFAKQFDFNPVIENEAALIKKDKFVVCGMGGSNLSPMILKAWQPEFEIIQHKDYGLPPEASSGDYLIVCSSYSGNTEETIDSFKTARKNNLPLIVIAIGGALLKLAKEASVPYVVLPESAVVPRMALGFSFKALVKIIGSDPLVEEVSRLSATLKPDDFETFGQGLAKELIGRVPVIYGSSRNISIIYNWKIKTNESGKIPAFYNVFPELNHNELNGFDVKESSRGLSEIFYFLILRDSDDDQRIQHRMGVTAKLYKARQLKVKTIDLTGATRLEKIFTSLITADWFSYYTARNYKLEPELIPMIEEFKKLLS